MQKIYGYRPIKIFLKHAFSKNANHIDMYQLLIKRNGNLLLSWEPIF